MTNFYLSENNVERPFSFSEKNLPILISGGEGSGASFFSVSAVSQLFLLGLPILFYSLKPAASDQFEAQVASKSSDVFHLENARDIDEARSHKAVIIESGNTKLAQLALEQLVDERRILFIKNFEATLTKELWEVVRSSPLLLLSGDLPNAPLHKNVDEKPFATTIVFSDRKGYFLSDEKQGIIRVEK